MPDQVMLNEVIDVRKDVYHNQQGESGIGLRILELRQKLTPYNGIVTQALCTGLPGGFGVGGMYSEKHKVEVRWLALAYLTHTPNRRGAR